MKKLTEFYNSVVSETGIFGIEKKFIDLSRFSGPANPEWVSGQTIYEIYPRSFSSAGTLAQITKRLPEIAGLGIKIIWLMPIYPIGRKDRKGSLGSPYAVQDYFSVNPEYGSAEDFKTLVKAAHKLRMKVILDMVANHVSPDFEEQGILQRDEKGSIMRKYADWTDIADLDYGLQETREFMLQVLKFWLEEFDIDGYRCDVAGYVPMDFWEPAAEELRRIKNDFYLLAEWESPLMHKKAFNSTYDWGLYWLMKKVRDGQKAPQVLLDWVQLKNSTYPADSLPLRFVENHDYPRASAVFGKTAQIPYLAFIFAVSGIPLIYNGQETGTKTGLSLFEKEPIDWSDYNEDIRRCYFELIQLRKRTKALTGRECLIVEQDFKNDVLVFLKPGNHDTLVLLNFRQETFSIHLPEEIGSRFSKGSVIFNSSENLIFNGREAVLLPFQAVYIQSKL